MFNEEQEIIRIEKLKNLREKGINPYPYKFELTHTLSDIRKDADKIIARAILAELEKQNIK